MMVDEEKLGVEEEKKSDGKKMAHDVGALEVDLNALTEGDIDWTKAVKSLKWMVEKTESALEDHKEDIPNISQFLAKTCVMHVIQCFHHCRNDAPPGFAHAEEWNPNPPPSEKEPHTKCDTADHSSPPCPSP